MEVTVKTAPPMPPERTVTLALSELEFRKLIAHVYAVHSLLSGGQQQSDAYRMWDQLTNKAAENDIDWFLKLVFPETEL